MSAVRAPSPVNPLDGDRAPEAALSRLDKGECIHCGLPVPSAGRRAGDRFCCEGCRRVFELIHDAGLDRYYDLRSSRTAPPAEERPDGFAWLDRLLDESCLPGDEPESRVRRLTLDVQGVHCAACVWLLQELFQRWSSGVELRINPSLGRADVAWDSERGELTEYLREAERFGYRFGPPRKVSPRRSHALLWRLGVCTAAALNVMMFSLSFYFGLAPSDGALYPFFGWLNFALGTVAVLAGGTLFFRGAWQGVRRKLVHLDLPISLGIALAYGGSVFGQLTRGPEAAYFDSLTVFIALMVLGRWLQERLLEKNRLSLLTGDDVAGLTTRRFREGRLEAVAATALATGDEIWIAPGDLVPLDGILLDRAASLSLDWINGESRPREAQPGERVLAGSFNAGEFAFRLTAVQPFTESRLNDLLRAGSAPAGRRADRWWHRVSTVYVSAVLGLGAAGFLAWSSQGAARALEVTIAILVVTCPCALGLATPLAHDLIHSALRRRGIFVRDGSFLDRALGVRKILFDKTGTLTLGRLALTGRSRRAIERLAEPQRRALANLVARSNHPVSRCLTAALSEKGTGAPVVRDGTPVREVAGEGLEWTDGPTTYRLGRASFALGNEKLRELASSDTAAQAAFSANGEPIAFFSFREALRSDALEEIRALAREGREIHILSGDSHDRVAAAAAALGIVSSRAIGRLTPEEKAARVTALDEQDTLMIGDGLNDRPSFDAAYAAATPAVEHAALPARADFYFLGAGISAVRASLDLARRLRTVVRDNLILAAVYNAAALALCFAGLVTPVVAAVLMPLSSAGIVTLTATRLSEGKLSWK